MFSSIPFCCAGFKGQALVGAREIDRSHKGFIELGEADFPPAHSLLALAILSSTVLASKLRNCC
jgi:hypothetical protein